MKVGSFVLTVTKPLPSTEYDLLHSHPMEQTWGMSTVFIQRRKPRVNKKELLKAEKLLSDISKLLEGVSDS